MQPKKFFIVGIVVFICLVSLIVIYVLKTEGWNSPLSTEYSQQIEPNMSLVSQVRSITLLKSCYWDNCASYKITFHNSGAAVYTGLKAVQKIGTYNGKTSEFPNLATWIESFHLQPFQDNCSDAIVSVEIVVNDKHKVYSKCNPNEAPIEFRAMIKAIDDAASRIKWQKQV